MRVEHELKGKINTIIMDIQSIMSEHNIEDKESFLGDMSNILCQMSTDVAIRVMENLGEEGKYQAHAIKVNFGY
jgi:hypothetical protein